MSRLELTSLEAVRRSLLSGLGFAAVPKISVAHDLRARSLVRLPVPTRIRSICAVRGPGPGGTAIDAFWPMLSSAVRAGATDRADNPAVDDSA